MPTSPKIVKNEKLVQEIYSQSDPQSFKQPAHRSKNGLLIVIIATLAGFLAGLLGEVIINALAVSYPNLPIIKQLYLNSYPNDSRIIIQKSEKSITASEFEIQQTIRESRSKAVTIFLEKNNNLEDPLGQAYHEEEAKGSGIILTNDGLIMASNQVIDDMNGKYVAVTSDKNIYPITNLELDPISNTVFFRIDAKNLIMAGFADPADLKAGQRLVSFVNKIDGSYAAKFTEIQDLHYYFPKEGASNLVFSSDFFNEKMRLTSYLPDEFKGAPLLTLDGKVAGIAFRSQSGQSEVDSAIPAQQFRTVIPQLLKNGTIERVWLGIHYLDLSKLINVPKDLSQGLDQGALVYGDDVLNLPAVLEQSPAAKAELKTGDIITKVNTIEVNSDNSLEALLQEYEAGKEIELVVMRNNQEVKQKIKLDKLPE